MNPWLKPRGLSLPLRTDLIASRSTTGRNNRHHDRCPLEAGLTFLHGKAISCQNPYVTVQVQTVAPRFQGVSKHTQCSTSVLKQELAIWLGRQQISLVFWLGASPLRRRAIHPPLGKTGASLPVICEWRPSPGTPRKNDWRRLSPPPSHQW